MTGRVKDLITNPNETARLHEVIEEGEYYGMQTFDQALLGHLQSGRISMETALRTATHPHDFKLLVAADGRRSTSMDDLEDVNERAAAGNGHGNEPVASGNSQHVVPSGTP